MDTTTTGIRYFRAHPIAAEDDGKRHDGDVRCETHALPNLNGSLLSAGIGMFVQVDNMDDGMELLNLLSRINGKGGKALTLEIDPEFQVCPECEARDKVLTALSDLGLGLDGQKEAS
jgi:hypothetical protein